MARKPTNVPGPGALAVGYEPPVPKGRLTDDEKAAAIECVRQVNEALFTRGVTPAEFSRQIGMSQASVSRLLRGDRYATRPFILVARKWLAGVPIQLSAGVPKTSDADEMLTAGGYDNITADPWLDLPEI